MSFIYCHLNFHANLLRPWHFPLTDPYCQFLGLKQYMYRWYRLFVIMLLTFLVFCSVGCPMLPVSLDCPFFFAISVFSNVYLHYWHIAIPVLSMITCRVRFPRQYRELRDVPSIYVMKLSIG